MSQSMWETYRNNARLVYQFWLEYWSGVTKAMGEFNKDMYTAWTDYFGSFGGGNKK
jgi:hypothetical protein